MKKLCILLCVLFIVQLNTFMVSANEYLTFQSIEFERHNQKLLMDYSDYDYTRHYARVENRRFWGWQTHIVTKNEPVSFIKDTHYYIRNEGSTSIDQTFYFKTNENSRVQISATGNIGMSVSGDIEGFKLGLSREIKPSISVDKSEQLEEQVDIRIKVDPMTELTVAISGEGRVTNGVGKYYRFWRNSRSGGFEVFVVTTEFFSIEKVRIAE